MRVFARFLARMWLSGVSLLVLALATWGFARLPVLQRPSEPTRTAGEPLPPAAPPRAPAVLPAAPVVAAVPPTAPVPVPPAAFLQVPVGGGPFCSLALSKCYGGGAAFGGARLLPSPRAEGPGESWPGASPNPTIPVAARREPRPPEAGLPAAAPAGLAPAAFAPPFGGPTQPLPPPSAGGITAEERLEALEQQNLLLAAELAAIRRQLPPRPAGREAPLGNLQEQLGRQRDPNRDIIETGEEPLPRARVDLTQGIRLLSPDGKYRIELHDLTQFDARFFSVTSPSGTSASQGALHDSFVIPRQRLYFTGQVDDYFDFYSVLNRGYGSLDVLDSFVNFKFDQTFNIRVGRTKTPYGYEYYKIAEGDLIAPERSVFVGNLSPNRQLMAMAFGRLLEERVEYAVGVESGPHRSFQDFNNYKNPVFYLNTKPFLYGGSDLLRQLNIGGSVTFGREDDPIEPNALRTANDETVSRNATNVSPTFLQFNDGVVQRGGTAFWSGDIAWYYRSLTALAMYNGGYMTYATNTRSGVRVPYEGGSVALTFFITGEEIVRRREVEPLRDFSWRNPLTNPGAIELYTRTAYLNAGQDIFTGGLADPQLWSRNALVLDHGVNWYLNRFVQVRFDWQFSVFGSPVQIGPGRFTKSENMFWLRTQIYY